MCKKWFKRIKDLWKDSFDNEVFKIYFMLWFLNNHHDL